MATNAQTAPVTVPACFLAPCDGVDWSRGCEEADN